MWFPKVSLVTLRSHLPREAFLDGPHPSAPVPKAARHACRLNFSHVSYPCLTWYLFLCPRLADTPAGPLLEGRDFVDLTCLCHLQHHGQHQLSLSLSTCVYYL